MKAYVEKAKADFEALVGASVKVVEDGGLKAPCAVEYAALHGRDVHVLRINPQMVSDYAQYCVLTEAALRVCDVGGVKCVATVVSSSAEKDAFSDMMLDDPVSARLISRFGAASFAGFVNDVRTSIVTQCSNQVVEMLMNDRAVHGSPEVVSDMKSTLRELAVAGAAMNRADMLEMLPRQVVDAGRLMNLAFAMQASEICGERFIDAYRPDEGEIDRALDLYGIYRKERDAVRSGGGVGADVIRRCLDYLGLSKFAHIDMRPIGPKA